MSHRRYPKYHGSGRACIDNAAAHIRGALRGGTRHPQFNPHFEVKEQNEPKDSHKINQHKQWKGHRAGRHTA